MTVTFKVEGMMCGGCETRVKNALSNIEGVTSVLASHETKTVVVETDKDITNILKDKIEALGFDVID